MNHRSLGFHPRETLVFMVWEGLGSTTMPSGRRAAHDGVVIVDTSPRASAKLSPGTTAPKAPRELMPHETKQCATQTSPPTSSSGEERVWPRHLLPRQKRPNRSHRRRCWSGAAAPASWPPAHLAVGGTNVPTAGDRLQDPSAPTTRPAPTQLEQIGRAHV